MKTRKEMQTDLLRQIVALFPKDWNPQAEEAEESQEMMMIKIGAELARLNEIHIKMKESINNLGTNE
jgi:hypothetical protein